MPLLATYRLQLRGRVSLREARALAPYLERLGVSHLYLSPILRARRGSTHGYDVVDPTRVDPALGGEPALEGLARGLHQRGLGLLLDVVPNHMAADPQSPNFDDVLRNGAASRFAGWFDIDWNAPGASGRLLLPVLGDTLSRCIERGELRLRRDREGLRVGYAGSSYPIRAQTLPRELARAIGAGWGHRRGGDAALRRFAAGPAGRRRLLRLLRRQPYRLAHWRAATRRLNYRRFFDVNELIALRVEDPAVFDATHAKVLELVARGRVDGLRIDHVDGILDPQAYLERLAATLRRLPGADPREPVPLLVEKILAPDESLPRSWPVEGTTGYEFLNAVEAVLLDAPGVAAIEKRWAQLVADPGTFEETAREAKREVLATLLEADARRLARALRALLARPGVPDPPEADLRAAIAELIAQLPVYRVYPRPESTAPPDRRRLAEALARAQREARAPRAALDRLGDALLREQPAPDWTSFRQRFQQLASPAAAKGVEDTALYRYTPLVSRNEVGGAPGGSLAAAVGELHRSNAERRDRWPRSLLAATTHDTKRSADVRARLEVLSEVPDAWMAAVARWRRWNAPLRRRVGRRLLPDASTEYLLYQTLVGIWPLATGPAPPDRRTLADLRKRLEAYMEKACREAKRRTSWIAPNAAFEAALRDFERALLSPARRESRRFLADLGEFVGSIERPGLWNAISRTLVQLASPGVPDLYQGDELWNFALVDPDNRRPVDFPRLRRALRQVEAGFAGAGSRRLAFVRRLVAQPEDGRLKLHVIRAGLHARRRFPGIFLEGDYEPLPARGSRAEHVFAFARRGGSRCVVAAVTRLPRALVADSRQAPIGAGVWGHTRLRLPRESARARSLLTGSRLRGGASPTPEVAVGELFAELPVALLLA